MYIYGFASSMFAKSKISGGLISTGFPFSFAAGNVTFQ